jgi:uncharacterized protein YjbI with pentapeptide repeats
MMNTTNAKITSESDLQLAHQRTVTLKAILDGEDSFKWWPGAPKTVSTWESGEFCDLRGSDLSNRKLGKLMLGECVLDDTNFSNSELSETALQGSSASRAKFTNAKLYRTQMIPFFGECIDFTGATLKQAFIQYAKLLNSTFISATLDDVSFSHTDVSRSSFVGARFTAGRLDSAVLRETDLSQAIFVDCNLVWAVFRHAQMSGAVLQNCDMSGADFRGADLARAQLRGGIFGVVQQGKVFTPTRFDDTPPTRRLVAESGAEGIDSIEWSPAEIPRDTAPQNVHAGQPCPRNGFWFTPALPGSRRYFKQETVMPELKSNYGATIWQWDQDQDPPKL